MSDLAPPAEPQGLTFRFQGAELVARPSRALWWPAEAMLILADMHLGKSARMARRGGALLPPWDSEDTLARLEHEVEALRPRHILSLGDAFDDDQAADELAADMRARLDHLQARVPITWISGNHDPGLAQAEVAIACITFRHQIGAGPDVSGHFHPVMRLGGRRWRCLVRDRDHLILPAFGSYTGGLDVESEDFAAVMPKGRAIIIADSLFEAPFPRRRLGQKAEHRG